MHHLMPCVQFRETGSPAEVLRCVNTEPPVPRRGEVLVKMLASPVNPSDLMFIRGTYGIAPCLPQTPGFEGVGIVESSGGGLRGRLFRGRRVAVLNRTGGNWARYAVVPADQVIPLSSRLSIPQAATFFVNPATAWIMTQEVLRVPKDTWLLQTAAGSVLGRMIIRLGNALGFRTLNVIRNPAQVAELKALGATEVVVFDPTRQTAENLEETVRTVTGRTALRYAIDPVGGATGSAVVRSLGAGGRLLVFGTLSGEPISFSPRTLMQQQASVEGFWLGHFLADRSLLFKWKLVRRITALIEGGILATEVVGHYALEQITEAVTAAEKAGVNGKLLLCPDNDN